LEERVGPSGDVSGHYFHQDLLVANRIYINNPHKHVDIGSRIDGFVAHVASFREIEVFDIRTLETDVKNILFRKEDFMNEIFDLKEYCDSISSLHAIEHFGLGRYGDKVDYYGHLKGLSNIYKMLKEEGTFYFSVPIGTQRIEFNAHRVFSLRYLIQIFEDKFEIVKFSYVNDEGELKKNAKLDSANIEKNFSCEYGCGIFELKKI
jgi:SAM-dependent methyltransferase